MATAKPRSRAKNRLKPEDLLASLLKDEIKPVYYLHASDQPPRGADKKKVNPFNDYLLDKVLHEIRRIVVDGNLRDMNYSGFTAPEADMKSVIEIAETYPMMRPKRLVVVKDAHEFNAEQWRVAERYLANPSPTTCLVFIGVHLPTRNKGGEAAKQSLLTHAAMARFAPFTRDREALPVLKLELKRRKVKIEERAISMLMEYMGLDLNELLQAIDKLALFVGEGNAIGCGDVEKCITSSRVEDIWKLQDAIAARQLGPSLRIMTKLMENSKPEDDLLLLGALYRVLQELAQLRQKLDQGLRAQALLSEYPGPPWKAKIRVQQASAFPTVALVKALNNLHTCDRAIRSSQAPRHTHFERFVMQTCSR